MCPFAGGNFVVSSLDSAIFKLPLGSDESGDSACDSVAVACSPSEGRLSAPPSMRKPQGGRRDIREDLAVGACLRAVGHLFASLASRPTKRRVARPDGEPRVLPPPVAVAILPPQVILKVEDHDLFLKLARWFMIFTLYFALKFTYTVYIFVYVTYFIFKSQKRVCKISL